MSTHSQAKEKFVVRTIHHLSCSGGTVISRCLAALKDVVLLSEIHPTTRVGLENIYFEPFDPLRQFQINYPDIRYKKQDDLKKIFHERLAWVVRRCKENNKVLIVRDHSHSDFLIEGCEQKPTLLSFISDVYPAKTVVTLRNPIDSYLSLKSNRHFPTDFEGFDAYCQRVLSFLDQYFSAEILLYEDFVDDPGAVLKKICRIYDIQYDASCIENFHKFAITGNSGRGKDLGEIRKLERRSCDELLRKEIEESEHFRIFLKRYRWYSRDPLAGDLRKRKSFFRKFISG